MPHITFAARAFACMTFAGMAALTVPAAAQDADFFKDKTIKIIVGYGPGGGYDTYARLLAGPIAKKLGAKAIVENQPGAGGINALNKLVIAKPDGLSFMIVNGTAAAMAQLAGQRAVRYDLGKMSTLATIAKSPWVWMVHKDSPIKTIDDAIKSTKEIRWAASGPIDGLSDGALFTCEALKLKCKVIYGYKGSNDAGRAVMQGEMDAIYVSDTSAFNYAKAGGVRAVAVINRKPSRFFKDIKPIFDTVKLSKEAEWLFDFHTTVEDLGRIFVAPPNMQPGRLKVLQDAIGAVLTDKDIIAMGEKSRRYIDYVDAAQTRKNIATVVNVTPEEKARIRKVLLLP
ncbi:MAG: tripartite tricarboxylate transporter substrate-binding protein [Beijerinckiaceae bacterium]|jgi:tripartite-type tricarboxylate transporter receptor subunit TctC|nr:tripartite tricarboxylate transporter substrate-binding protein [Beijerinckiaceae bacterium]